MKHNQVKHFKKKPLLSALAALSAPVLAPSSQVYAQENAVEEITVTATRRAESIQDIPINISALSGRNIEEQGLQDLSELAQWVPGLSVIDQGPRGNNALIVRGLNTDVLSGSEANGNGGDSTVATYLGDIPVYIDLKLNDMERVEVLLGPQGTLYGAGTLAGAVRYIPNKPDLEEFSLELRGDISSISESDDVSSDFGLTLNVPMGDRLALRANLDYLDEAGFIDYNYLIQEPGVSNPEPDFDDPTDVAENLRSEEDANYEEALSARVSLLWEPIDSLSAVFSYHLQDQDIGGRQINHMAAFDTGEYEAAHRYLEYNSRKNELISLEVVADLGFAELTSATGYSEYYETGQRDQTDLLLDILPFYGDYSEFSAFTLEEEEEERFNQELRLVSTNDSDWNWIVGVFYNAHDTFDSSKEFAPGLDDFFGADALVDPDPFDGVDELVAIEDPLEFFAAGPEETKEFAVFGELGYQILDEWQVTVGGRFFDYEILSGGFTQFPLFPSINAPYRENEVSDSGSLFKFNTSYDLNEDVSFYFTISEGYRIGGVNRFPICTDEQIAVNSDDDPDNDVQAGCIFADQELISPDRTTNHELGLKSTFADGRITTNAAIFLIDWEDIQVGGFTPFSSENITLNGGEAESKGVELSFNGLLTDFFSLRGSLSYNQAELTEDAPALVDGEDALAGDRLSGAPETQASMFATFDIPANQFDLALNYGVSYYGDVLTRVGERAGGETLDAFTLHNVSAVFSKDNWRVRAYINNLTDEYYETSARSTPDNVGITNNDNDFTIRRYFKNVGTPRVIGASFSYEF